MFLFSSIHFQCLYRPDAQSIYRDDTVFYLSIAATQVHTVLREHDHRRRLPRVRKGPAWLHGWRLPDCAVLMTLGGHLG